MFTGIVTAKGQLVSSMLHEGDDKRLSFCCEQLDLESCSEGDSICVSGTCLTMLDIHPGGFSADVSRETLGLTTLGELEEGSVVNLELAMRANDRLGGHLVTGHVDGKAVLLERRADARSERFSFEVPADLARYVARKGSVCLDGVSLTVNGVKNRQFDVSLIPHTLQVTTLGALAEGQAVNLEIDLVARYIERLQMSQEGEAAV